MKVGVEGILVGPEGMILDLEGIPVGSRGMIFGSVGIPAGGYMISVRRPAVLAPSEAWGRT